LNNDNIEKRIEVFIKIFLSINENKDFNKLLIYLFKKFNINTILNSLDHDKKIIIQVCYCKYLFSINEFPEAKKLSILNIQSAEKMINNTMTEDIGWLLIKRSISYFSEQKMARNALNDVISNLKTDYDSRFRN
tara:strand:+ start:404 stop:805 length:402 start_codon:yes stop_codon:yes gene_type:complete